MLLRFCAEPLSERGPRVEESEAAASAVATEAAGLRILIFFDLGFFGGGLDG